MYSINGLPPIHPGEYIKEILQETGVSQSAFAKNLGVSS
ncbi:MAG: addiction module antidote protein, HigA family, partial [Desulfobacteraceae bacterium]